MARNALQIGGDDGNALAPLTFGDPTDPVSLAGTQNTVAGADALGQWLAEQRAKSTQMGMWDDATGMPTRAGWSSAGRQYLDSLVASTSTPRITAYHGSPHLFAPTERNPLGEFDPAKIGTGEGAQAYGVGAGYLAEREGVAKGYRDNLTPQTVPNPEFHALQREYNAADAASGDAMTKSDAEFNEAIAARDAVREKMKGVPALIPNPAGTQGHMYEVNVHADPEHFLHWDKPLSEQSQRVQERIKGRLDWVTDDMTGARIYQGVADRSGKPRDMSAVAATEQLKDWGIPGIRYLDAGSRSAGEGSHNLVVFSPEIMEIIRRYGIAGLMAGGGAAAATQQQQPNALQQ